MHIPSHIIKPSPTSYTPPQKKIGPVNYFVSMVEISMVDVYKNFEEDPGYTGSAEPFKIVWFLKERWGWEIDS